MKVKINAFVFRTHHLARIASIDPVADFRAEFIRQKTFRLRLKSDAALGVELSRIDKRTGRAGLNALVA